MTLRIRLLLEREYWENRHDLGIPPDVGGFVGGMIGVDEDLHIQAPSYGSAIHCDVTYSSTLLGGRAETMIMGT